MRRHYNKSTNSGSDNPEAEYIEWLKSIGCKLYAPLRQSFMYEAGQTQLHDVINNIQGTCDNYVLEPNSVKVQSSKTSGLMWDLTSVANVFGDVSDGGYFRNGAWTTIASIKDNGGGYVGNKYEQVATWGESCAFYIARAQCGTWSTNTWHNIAYLHQSPNVGTTVTIYKNNSQVFTQASTTNALVYRTATNNKIIAMGKAYSGCYFFGNIHDVYHFNRRLTTSELTTIYNHDKQYNL